MVTLNEKEEALGNAVGEDVTGDNVVGLFVVGLCVVGSNVVGALDTVGASVGFADMVGDNVGDSVTQRMLGHAIMPQHSARHASFVV